MLCHALFTSLARLDSSSICNTCSIVFLFSDPYLFQHCGPQRAAASSHLTLRVPARRRHFIFKNKRSFIRSFVLLSYLFLSLSSGSLYLQDERRGALSTSRVGARGGWGSKHQISQGKWELLRNRRVESQKG